MPRGRKPVDQEAVGGVLLRQRMWQAMRAYGERWWKLDHIAIDAKAAPAAVQSYVHALHRASIVLTRSEWRARSRPEGWRDGTPVVPRPFEETEFRVLRDVGAEAPRVTKDGRFVETLTATAAIWRAVRVSKQFTWTDIAVFVGTSEAPASRETVKAYLSDLARAGYLRRVAPERPGTPAVWALRPERNTGPRPPQVQRTRSIFDPNEGRVVWSDTPDAEPLQAVAHDPEAA